MAARKTAVTKTAPPATDPIFAEVGGTGLKQWGGYIADEYLPELRGASGRKIYREMSENDPTIGACLSTFKHHIVRTPITMRPASQDAMALRVADLVQTALDDMQHTLHDTFWEALSFLDYGWSWMEIVHKRRLGDQPWQYTDASGAVRGLPPSQYSDGMVGWHKWAPRGQESLLRWEFDSLGDVAAMVQQLYAPVAKTVAVPIRKSLHHVGTPVRGNPEGISCLRTAYVPWYFHKRIRVTEGIGIERDLAGFPVIRIPGSIITKANGGDSAAQQIYEAYKTFGKNLRRDEQECAVLPSDNDANGKPLYELVLLSTGGRRQFDTSEIQRRLDIEKAVACLADFVLLGHGNTGTYALAQSKVEDIFSLVVQARADTLIAQLNHHAVPELVRLNGFAPVLTPKVIRGKVESIDLAALGDYIQKVSGTFPEIGLVPGLLDALLNAASLPTSADTTEVGKRAEKLLNDLGHKIRPRDAAREAREIATKAKRLKREHSDAH